VQCLDRASAGRAVLPVSHHVWEDGQGRGKTGKTEYFAYVLEGNASIMLDAKRNRLEAAALVLYSAGQGHSFSRARTRGCDFPKALFSAGQHSRADADHRA